MKKFSERLKDAMQELGINQKQVVCLTGKSKGSVSMYLNDKTVPPENVRKEIALALGLAADYFETGTVAHRLKRKGAIEEIRPRDVGRLMRMSHVTVEEGLKQGVFPWGYAIKAAGGHYRYFINAKRFAEHEGIDVPPDMVV